MEKSRHHLSRRGFCLCCAGAALGGWLSPRDAYAEARGLVSLIKDSARIATITARPLRGGVFVLEGSGGNIAVLPGKDGTVMVDAGIGVSEPQIRRALAELSTAPVTQLINTHWHFDHADGNAWLGAAGAHILAHANTQKYLSQVQRVDDWDYNFLPQPEVGLPAEVISDQATLTANGASLVMNAYAPAHTDSDLSVTFTEADIVHVGDTYWNGVYPFIDRSTGGNIDGMIAACDATLATVTDKTIIIPGHGKPESNRSELQEFRDMLVACRDAIAACKLKGLSLDDTIALQPTRPFDAQYGGFVIDPAFFTRLVYEDV